MPQDKYSYHYNNNLSKSFPAVVRRFYIWNNSLSRPRDISIDQFCYTQSGLRYFDLLQPGTLYLSKVTVTPENIEDPLIMTQQSLTQFFNTTSNKRKSDGSDDDRKTTVTPQKKENTRTNAKEHVNNLRQHASQKVVLCLQHHSNFEFARLDKGVFSRVGLVLESVGLATNDLKIARAS